MTRKILKFFGIIIILALILAVGAFGYFEFEIYPVLANGFIVSVSSPAGANNNTSPASQTKFSATDFGIGNNVSTIKRFFTGKPAFDEQRVTEAISKLAAAINKPAKNYGIEISGTN